MHRIRVASLPLLLALSTAGCMLTEIATVEGGPQPPVIETEAPIPGALPAEIAGAASWTDHDAIATLPESWTVARCEGDAPLLCVRDPEGAVAGTLELLSFPGAAAEGDAITAGSPPSQVFAADVAGYVETFVTDRAVGCGDGYRVDASPAVNVAIGDLPAVRFGYTAQDATGTHVETQVQWRTAVGDTVHVVALSAYAPGSCMFSDEFPELVPAILDHIAPALFAAVEAMPLPGR